MARLGKCGGIIAQGVIALSAILPVVYLLDGSAAVTGAFMCARNIAKALRNRARVVLVLGDSATVPPEWLSDFAEVRRVPLRHLRRNVGSVMRYGPALLKSSGMLWKWLREDGASTLLINDFYLMHGALARLMGFRGRILTWVRIDPTRFGIIGRIWLSASVWCSDAVIAVSRHIQQGLGRHTDSALLYDAYELPVEMHVRNSPSVASHTFAYVGNYVEGKGQDVALKALASIVADCPSACIAFYGGDLALEKNREYRRRLEQLSHDLGLERNVSFHGFTEDPSAVLAESFAALNFSRSESFSMTVLEAAAVGVPVVATRCGGPEEIVRNSETGLLVPVDDVEQSAQAMRWLYQNPERARAMGEAARALVAAEFSMTRFRHELERMLLLPPTLEVAA